MAIAPTLLIGVGGQGLDIVRAVAKRMGDDRSKRIQMVVFDTDANDLAGITEEVPGIHAIQTSPNMTVGEALAANPYARDTWFPCNQILEGKSMTEGAGQVRAISRLALEQTILRGGMTPLHDAISELQLLSADNYVQGVRAIVCGSIAGGTGSGMFLPLGLYLRNYLRRECNLKGINIRGFFPLPDVIGNTVLARNNDQRENLRANAYAAIRELDAFVGKADGNSQDKYPAVEYDIPKTASEDREMYPAILPYDHVFLMDYRNVNGCTLRDKDSYIQYAADTIYAFAISPISGRSNSTEDNEIRRISNVDQNGRCRYAAAGCAEIRYPMDVVGEYVALNWTKDAIGKEWIALDKQLEDEEKIARKAGRDFNYAARYLDHFEDLMTTGNSPFYRALGFQVKGTMKVEAGDEGKPVFPITLWSLMPPKDEVELVEEEDDGFSAIESANANAVVADIVVDGDVAGKYVEAIKNVAMRKLTQSSDRYKTSRDTLDLALTNLEVGDVERGQANVSNFDKAAASFKDCVESVVPEISKQVACDLFSFTRDRDTNATPSDYDLEAWIVRAGTRDIVHPSAVRYIVYKAMEDFRKILPKFMEAQDVLTAQINAGLADGSYDKAGDAMEHASSGGLIGGGKKVQEGQAQLNAIASDKRRLGDKLLRWAEAMVMKSVCEEASKFLTALSKSFKEFYKYIESTIPTIDIRIQSIERNKLYNAHSVEENGVMGSSVRYVCVDSKSLDNILRRTPRQGNSAELDGSVTTAIYRAVLKKAEHDMNQESLFGKSQQEQPKTLRERRAMMDAESNQRRRFFEEVFEKSVIGYWSRQVLQGDNASEIDLDVIQALRKEAEYSGLIESSEIEAHVKGVLQSGLSLSQVFLPVTSTFDRNPIIMYDPDLLDPYDQGKTELLSTRTFGGSVVNDEKDPNLNCQQILFYQACYGIAAKKLPQFMCPAGEDRDDARALNGQEKGQYYASYFELIRHLSDNLNQGSYISPHTDARWHLAFQFPDIDEAEGSRQRYNVVRAFVYSVLFSKIKETNKGSGLVYEAVVEGKRRRLEVNDRVCNEFFEIFEALMINNRLVYDLLADCEKNRLDESNLSTLGRSILARNLKSKSLSFYQVDGDPNPHIVKLASSEKLPDIDSVTSIYDVSLFYEMTKPASVNHGDFIPEIVESAQNVIYSYLNFLVSESERDNTAALFFIEQYLRFRKTVCDLVSKKPSVAHLESIGETRIKLDHWFFVMRQHIAEPYFEFWNELTRVEDDVFNSTTPYDFDQVYQRLDSWVNKMTGEEAKEYQQIWAKAKPLMPEAE